MPIVKKGSPSPEDCPCVNLPGTYNGSRIVSVEHARKFPYLYDVHDCPIGTVWKCGYCKKQWERRSGYNLFRGAYMKWTRLPQDESLVPLPLVPLPEDATVAISLSTYEPVPSVAEDVISRLVKQHLESMDLKFIVEMKETKELYKDLQAQIDDLAEAL